MMEGSDGAGPSVSPAGCHLPVPLRGTGRIEPYRKIALTTWLISIVAGSTR